MAASMLLWSWNVHLNHLIDIILQPLVVGFLRFVISVKLTHSVFVTAQVSFHLW